MRLPPTNGRPPTSGIRSWEACHERNPFCGRLHMEEIFSWEPPHERITFVGVSTRKGSFRGRLESILLVGAPTRRICSWEVRRTVSSRGIPHEKNLFVGPPTKQIPLVGRHERNLFPGGGCFYFVLFCTCASGVNGGGSGPKPVIFVTRRGPAEDPPLGRSWRCV